ncbi:hypothetical protein SAMN05192583_3090 [Sphingomonas gellani]|uniref:Uncharacterized protein n=1 Tax=Sphingomonas gellani TaxID=1166340 RepID=A0A1H8HLH7_9SPHN|nr:hypothetical protein [Sphingomonas gellani]SEN56847.1 hypothetical protein SAMN05192583_3090 [Sphingomonas gellani]
MKHAVIPGWAMAATGSAVLVLIVVCVAVLVWRRRDRHIGSPEEVAEAAEQGLSGFETVDAVVGADGSGALAVGRDGRIAAAKRRGKRIAVREVPWQAVRSTAAGILVETDEPRFGRVILTGVDVLDIRRLAPSVERRRLAS